MGWSGGTEIFDCVAQHLLTNSDVYTTLKDLFWVLGEKDWDTESESKFYSHPLVQKVIHELYPDWEE